MNTIQTFDDLKPRPVHVGDIWKHWARESPDSTALLDANGHWSYVEFQSVIGRTKEFLLNAGVRPGDRVMLVCENSREFIALYFAVAEINAWPALVNARLSSQEVDQIREHCRARRVLFTSSASPHAMKHAKQQGAQFCLIEGMREIGLGPLNEAVQPEALDPLPGENVAALIYTSGTTGQPKGVMLTHANLLFMAEHSARIRSVGPQDRLLGVLPMSHAVGLAVVLLGTLVGGGSVYVCARFDPPAILTALEKDSISIMMGAPAMFALMTEFAKLKKILQFKSPKLRIISSSGAPLQLSVKEETEKVFGMVLHNGYGVTECSPTISLTRPEAPRKDVSVGRIFPDIDVRLVDQDHQEVGRGEVGELWVKGPNVMKGYYRAPEETAMAINPDGWFNTRDLARIEDDHLFIVGRTKELIVRFGFNVYPAEVEAVLNTCAGVARTAVIGRTANAEEEIIAFVQLVKNSLTTREEIGAHAAKNLAAYKHPSQIIVVDDLPLTPTGKVAKRELEKRFARELAAKT